MEPIQITLNPPITEHCKDCDYEKSRSFFSKLVTCPECGSKNMKRGDRRVKDLFSVRKSHDSYSKKYQYEFYNLPDGSWFSFTVGEDIDDTDIFELIEDLKVEVDSYLLYGRKLQFENFYKMVMSEKFRDEYEKDSLTNKRIKLESELYRFYLENSNNN